MNMKVSELVKEIIALKKEEIERGDFLVIRMAPGAGDVMDDVVGILEDMNIRVIAFEHGVTDEVVKQEIERVSKKQ